MTYTNLTDPTLVIHGHVRKGLTNGQVPRTLPTKKPPLKDLAARNKFEASPEACTIILDGFVNTSVNERDDMAQMGKLLDLSGVTLHLTQKRP